MPTQQLDDISVSWHCIIPDIPALAFNTESKQSHVIFFSRYITSLCKMSRHYISNVNIFLQYAASRKLSSLLYFMPSTATTKQVPKNVYVFLSLSDMPSQTV